jgi:predicted transposase YdaD
VRELNAIADYKWDEGMAQGIAIGEAKGRAEGKAEGKAEGMKSLLLHQLESKFGSLSSQCLTALDSASMEELARYSESLLSAASAEEVFKNEI